MTWRLVRRGLVTLVVTAVSLWVAAAILDGFAIAGVGAAFLLALVLGLLNGLVWPLMIRLTLPFAVLTFGLGTLALNGAFLLIAADIVDGVRVDDFGVAVLASLIMTVVTLVLSTLLAIDDDDFWHRNVVSRQAKRTGVAHDDVPGVIFLEIDGLSHDVLRRAIRGGYAPTIARWLHDRSHRLEGWECDWSSQTGAMQAGILHGSNDDMPAFRWWEKERGTSMVSNHPRDAMEIERRHSDGRGLLHKDGASRANLLSGDAAYSSLTMSTVLRRDRPGRIGQDYYAYFVSPYNVTRTIALIVAEIASELWHARQQRIRDVLPRVHRGYVYSLLRAWTTVVQRDLQVQAVLADALAGRPVVYTTFLGYDEVAHHSGPERPDALVTLRKIDHEFARLERAVKSAPRPYELVVLADHGQTQGTTFLQLTGQNLEQLVRAHTVGGSAIAHEEQGDEAAALLSASMTGKVKDTSTAEGEEVPDVVVLASGCLGLVSFPREPGRLTLEQIDRLHPGLVDALRLHPAIGFVLVRSESRGPLVLGSNGTVSLDADEVEGEDPLLPFGPNARSHVRRTDGFAHCADLMLNSVYREDTLEVAAFEELVGSHGGLGGPQSHPFVLAPAGWPEPAEPIVGAEAMHRQLRRWLVAVGHHEYEQTSEPVAVV
jgi:uncharacterized membrane protein YvlD (DUF360 family)